MRERRGGKTRTQNRWHACPASAREARGGLSGALSGARGFIYFVFVPIYNLDYVSLTTEKRADMEKWRRQHRRARCPVASDVSGERCRSMSSDVERCRKRSDVSEKRNTGHSKATARARLTVRQAWTRDASLRLRTEEVKRRRRCWDCYLLILPLPLCGRVMHRFEHASRWN